MATRLTTKKRRAEQALWTKLDEHLLPLAAKGVVLAVSGGPDSRALLEALANWQHRDKGRFVVVTIDHGVRDESREEALFIAKRARRLGFDSEHESLLFMDGVSGEQDLRAARYRLLKSIGARHNCSVICTAHHQDDDVEGYFMALMGVGGGEMGASMSEILNVDGYVLCRPFLMLQKRDLLLYLTLSEHTDFARDRLDEAKKGQRAYVRHEVFPALFKLAPSVKKRLASFGQRERERHRSIDNMARSLIIWQEDRATIQLASHLDCGIFISAVRQILKKWSNGKDLRACQATIERLASDLFANRADGLPALAGLDRPLNGFNLKHLGAKVYQLPGAHVLTDSKDIIVRRL